MSLEPLQGGVSCDVFRVRLNSGTVCVKQALAKLRVAADWRAPTDRAHVEAEWLREAETAGVPAPRVFYEDRGADFFVMSYFDEATHDVWKSTLSGGQSDPAFAAKVGQVLARMHLTSWRSDRLARAFQNAANFEALRIDPFLLYPARHNADVAGALTHLAERTRSVSEALVHGDFSPKNILKGPDGPVILDAECATYGDPAFDLAFCITHLLLKAARWTPAILDDARSLGAAYAQGMAERFSDIDSRAVGLIAAIMFARVEGKSPVDYLRPADQGRVRQSARHWLASPPASVTALLDDWQDRIRAA